MLVQWLLAHGHWKELGSKLQVRREGGFVGVDIVLFLLLFFSAGARRSLKHFGEWTGPFRKELGALGGRETLASPSSVSRFLSAAQGSDVRGFAQWLLVEVCDIKDVLQHPAAAAYDTQGQPWHLFDWDGTTTVLRQRALPTGDDLPPPVRRSEATGTPGYTGRKRGEVRFMRATLQHAGSGLWLDAVVAPERNDTAATLPSALDAIVTACQKAELASEKAVLRADGCGGNVPFIAACRQRRVPFLVRSSHYSLLNEPAIREALREATWYEVPSSGSGPTRLAAELGEVQLRPGRKTVSAEGEKLEPVRVRMVVSRFAAKEKSGAGIVIDDWQYELYATDLPASAWPAPEVVELYYGRCGQENRFAQEDREHALDRIFSYHLPGQELAIIVALFLWNWRTTIGFAENPPPARAPVRAARTAVVTEPLHGDDTTAVPEFAHETPPPSSQIETAPPRTHHRMPAAATSALGGAPALQPLLNQLPWDEITKKLPPNWQREEAALRCHAGALLPVSAIARPRQGRAPRVEFLASLASCGSCPADVRCVDASATATAKKVTRAISPELADALRPLLADKEVKRGRRAHGQEPPAAPRSERSLSPPPSSLIAPIDDSPGPFESTPPLLLPAALRHATQRALENLDVRIQVTTPPSESRHPALANSAAERQNRRLRWTQHLHRYALPPNASVTLYFEGDAAVLRRYLPDEVTSNQAA